jgi:hypothetical protein
LGPVAVNGNCGDNSGLSKIPAALQVSGSNSQFSMSSYLVRPATVRDAKTIAQIHVTAAQAAYKTIRSIHRPLKNAKPTGAKQSNTANRKFRSSPRTTKSSAS